MNPFFRALALLPLLTLARPAHAQPLPDRAPIRGVISDAKGAPVAGAVLSLRRAQSNLSVAFWGAVAATDEAGNFAFPDAEEGDYALSAQAAGYADLTPRQIQWRTDSSPLRLTMERLVDFTLDLRAPDGSPLAGAPVYLRLRPSDINNQKIVNARTDAAGALRVTGVKPARYALYLRAPQGIATLFDLSVVEPVTAPRAITLERGGALNISVADERGRALGGASLSLAPATVEESRRLSGFETPGEDFALLAATGNRSLLVSRDGDGTIELDGLPAGVYSPRLSLPGYRFESLEPIQIGADAPLDLKISAPSRRARTLNLQLRTPDDKPYTRGEVSLRILPIAANGQLGGDPPPNPEDADELPFFPSGPGGRRALPDAQGRVSLYPVKAGRYRIFAAPQVSEPGKTPPEATPVDVTITAMGATATVVVPNG